MVANGIRPFRSFPLTWPPEQVLVEEAPELLGWCMGALALLHLLSLFPGA